MDTHETRTNESLIGLACDHAGFPLKEHVKTLLEELGLSVHDYGTYTEESCDYPDYAHALGNALERGEVERGIAVCGSAQGVAMTLNKHQNVRAALAWIPEIAQLARQHNDANVLCLPGRFLTNEQAHPIIQAFLTTPFEGGRHQRRVQKIPLTNHQ